MHVPAVFPPDSNEWRSMILITRATFLVATGIMSACYSPVLLADSAASTASTVIDDSDESGPATATLSTSDGDSTSAGTTAGTTSGVSASGAMSDSSGEPTD